jgi:lysophospholipase L1-like esterase
VTVRRVGIGLLIVGVGAAVAVMIFVMRPFAAAGQLTGTYVALGDSLAAGVGATAPAERGYVGRLYQRLLDGTSIDVEQLNNVGVSGETSETIMTRGQLAAAVARINDPESDVRIVTLDIGANDVLRLLLDRICFSDPAGVRCRTLVTRAIGGIAENLRGILGQLNEALRADPGDEALLVMTYYNPFSGTGTIYEAPVAAALLGEDGVIDCRAASANAANQGLNDLIACIGDDAGWTVVDLHAGFLERGTELTHIVDADVHPNDRGYQEISRALEAALPD